MSTESISTILQRSLDLIQVDGSPETKGAEPSASSILIAERKQLKEASAARQLEDFVPLASSAGQNKVANAYLEQIADSSIDAPTYWKGVGTKKTKGKKNVETVLTNAKKASRLKGESYEDKRTSKYAHSASRKDRMHRLKNMY